ncbi:glycosyltransferase [Pseudomaricurvus alcaniphilus]|uniref:glycosyltransferase family 4 protein n=1 Tax=Pseudomaricurvus alcaniphilus TaxID=1166482 RepID=UPI00140AE313|nr:glycosyltransferase family 4 protein [Pseudomaricurvus alcaniphilus]NHN36707.1 glycosyltransferase [Pseudomaricurvus alcaniphilus]
MKILFLSQRFVLPMDTGGKIRTGNILRELNKLAQVTVISNVESPKDDPYLDEMQALCHRFIPVPWKEAERYSLKFYASVLMKKFSRYPVSVLNDYSRALENALLSELELHDYDLLICDFLQSSLNVRQVSGIPTLLFQHNVEAQITQRHLERASNPVARLFWSIQHKRMLRHEKAMCRWFDGVIAVSDSDKSIMENWYGATHVYTIPTGVDVDFFKPLPDVVQEQRLVFTGSLDWLPNEDALVHFIESIFPEIKATFQDVKLLVVGRKPPPRLERLVNGRADIELTGWVDDTRPYIAGSAVYIVPIRIGGGTRMKIYEALAMGKALVSTTIGAEGLPLVDGEHFLNADEDGDFAKAVIGLLQDESRRLALGDNARNYVVEHFGWSKVAQTFLDVCQTVANDRSGGEQIKSSSSGEVEGIT